MALLVALMAGLLLTAMGTALVLNTSAETMIAANYREAQQGAYAAEAAFARTRPEFEAAASWDPFLTGATRSAFTDGAPGGTRTLSDGSMLDLTSLLSVANCAKATGCSSADMNRATAERPWGANNPRWELYAYGALTGSRYYLVVLVGDDGSEQDANPLADGVAGSPGAGVLEVRAEAFGPRGSHHRVDLTLLHDTTEELQVVSWREIR